MRAGETSLAGSYGIRVAQGLVQASGMHTCLHTSSSLNKRPYPLERERNTEREKGGEGALPGPAPQLPAPAWGELWGGDREDQEGEVPEVWIRRL